MNCQELAEKIQQLQPEASTQDVARLCLLLANSSDQLHELQQIDNLKTAWKDVSMKLQAATDQHAGVQSDGGQNDLTTGHERQLSRA